MAFFPVSKSGLGGPARVRRYHATARTPSSRSRMGDAAAGATSGCGRSTRSLSCGHDAITAAADMFAYTSRDKLRVVTAVCARSGSGLVRAARAGQFRLLVRALILIVPIRRPRRKTWKRGQVDVFTDSTPSRWWIGGDGVLDCDRKRGSRRHGIPKTTATIRR